MFGVTGGTARHSYSVRTFKMKSYYWDQTFRLYFGRTTRQASLIEGIEKKLIKILHHDGAKLMVFIFLWEKGCTKGFSIVRIFPIFPLCCGDMF